MKRELRVLIIEDMATDVDLLNHELQRRGLHFRSKHIESRESFLDELEHHRPDVILSDHGIPGFDGFTALEIARQRCPDVPFIFVTGAHGDEVAVETLKHGATDYVLKSRLHLLVPAIQRALRQASAREEHRRRIETALHQSQEHLALFAEAAREYALLPLDLEGRVTGWNPGAERLTGHRGAEALGREFTDFVAQSDRAKARQALKSVMREGKREESSWRALRKDGSEFPSSVTISPSRDQAGHTRGALCLVRDLTTRKHLADEAQLKAEHRTRQLTSQVEADYRELQEFTQALGLALRTPLRHMDNFVEVLQKNIGDQLDPKNQGFLKTIVEAGRQTEGLVDELMTFSRIGRSEMYHLHFSLAEIVKELVHDLSREAEGRQIQWVIGDLPEVVGDPTMLTMVLHNLLANAVKFTHPRAHARIEVRSTLTDDEVIVCVADNGVGFDSRHRTKLFGLFQRLHPEGEFEGLGVGLANVRRIIQRHGGRTWAEGAPGQGATFYFSLPRPAAKQEEPQES